MSYPSGLLSMFLPVKRRCFISYHHADEDEVRTFVRQFDDAAGVFSARALGVELDDDIVESSDTEYVMLESDRLDGDQ